MNNYICLVSALFLSCNVSENQMIGSYIEHA